MARIRSIHPGLFTDESFVSCSPLARLLVLGLWTEADDQGVFEWKPVTLKMRLLPVDGADVSALLGEIAEHNIIKRFEANGKSYGAVRNFRKYQRPKSPSAVHPLPAELRLYVAISETAGDERAPFPPKAEITPQMEDGGGREGEGENKDAASAASSASAPALDLIEAERRCREAAGTDKLGSFAPIAELLHRQADLERDVLPVIRSRPARKGGIVSWRYYVPIIEEAMGKAAPPSKSQGPPPVFIIEGSPEWNAWQAAEPGKLKAMQMSAGMGCYVASRFPPNPSLPNHERNAA
jgi:hypothetical protein